MSVFSRRPRAISILLSAAAGLFLVGLAASPASAATSTVTSWGSLQYAAAAGETNNLTITYTGSAYLISDSGAPVTAGAGCTSTGTNSATCPSAGVTGLYVTLNDGNDTATINGPLNTSVHGQDGDDTLTTSAGNDILYGGHGNDTLSGAAGHDYMNGEAGNDTLDGATGNDSLSGGDGNNTLTGGEGNDSITAGAGIDSMSGGAGDDYLNPGLGSDTNLSGGDGQDTVSYYRSGEVQVSLDGVPNDGQAALGEADNVGIDVENVATGDGSDTITGSAANNVLYAGGGNDTLSGLAGKDKLHGLAGSDTLNGGDGDDKLFDGDEADTLLGGAGDDYLDGSDYVSADVFSGGPGIDQLLVYRDADVAVTLNNNQADDGAPGESDNVKSDVEDITTGEGDDIIVGTAAANEISTGAGHDRITAGSGSDWINGGRGADTLNGNAGVDSIYGEGGADTITSQDKHADEVNCGSSIDSLNRDTLDDVSVTCETLT